MYDVLCIFCVISHLYYIVLHCTAFIVYVSFMCVLCAALVA